MSDAPFSRRQGITGPPVGTLIRSEIPPSIRLALYNTLRKGVFFNEHSFDLFNLVYSALQVLPPHVVTFENGWLAARQRIFECEWFQFLNLVEEIYKHLLKRDRNYTGARARIPEDFGAMINELFSEGDIGWQLASGRVFLRGNDAFEHTINNSVAVLEEDEKPTAAGHLRFALSALSARPKANTSGAVTHATSAVECVLGEITTGKKKGLSDYLQENPGLFHPALKEGLGKIYAYASDVARHGKEGTEPASEDAEFAFAACAAVCTLLMKKHPK
jgi:hypothetical protein